MTRNTHRIFGSLVSIPFLTTPIGLIGLIGSIAPDWDIKLGQRFHRTFTHSLLFLGFTSLILYSINKEIGFIWFLSYMSHLILDSFTESGVMLFYPIRKKSYGFKVCQTGGVLNTIIEVIGYMLLIPVIFFTIVNIISNIF